MLICGAGNAVYMFLPGRCPIRPAGKASVSIASAFFDLRILRVVAIRGRGTANRERNIANNMANIDTAAAMVLQSHAGA